MARAMLLSAMRRSRVPALLEREDCTLVSWYRSVCAPRTGGAYDSHHRTTGIAGRTRRSGRVAACGARAVSALPPAASNAPTERERTQWYFQRYVPHLPAAGEIVLFDRSWYNRAGV